MFEKVSAALSCLIDKEIEQLVATGKVNLCDVSQVKAAAIARCLNRAETEAESRAAWAVDRAVEEVNWEQIRVME
jgi:hypothetical protein